MAPQADPDDSLARQLRALRDSYLAELPDRLEALAVAWSTALEGERGAVARLRQLVHGLAGSGAVFGCREISTAAAAVERRLDELLDAGSTSAADLLPLAPQLDQLASIGWRYASNRSTAEQTSATSSDSSRPSSA
ncbi:MAG: hypothetical protein KatS3mg060_0195 [Dehalococcoidia bacterium]|nr:MAG: hypothetical protein KatS3mg060_0195 [Dehalococcoidia bacterium]